MISVESKKQEFGWVLDGFPSTKTQLKLLIEDGIIPDYFVTLDGEGLDEVLNARGQSGVTTEDGFSIQTLPFVELVRNDAKAKLTKLYQALEKRSIEYQAVSANGAVHEVFSSIRSLVDPFHQKASKTLEI